ncbi:MAG TPA: hypothetical protein VGQ00_04460 [Candidatus Norongarragalinales archaeon]|jgi:hypothetical protein|nr:hypothetical protein [Candidatus Norongarragalinales archaeon]
MNEDKMLQEWETARKAFYSVDDKLNAHCAQTGKAVVTCDNCGRLMFKNKAAKEPTLSLDFCGSKCRNDYLDEA